MVHIENMAPKQTDPQFKLRLTPELKQQIEQAANASGRSMNAEIIVRLQASFDGNFLDLSEEGLIAVARRMEAATATLEQMVMFQAPGYIEFMQARQEGIEVEALGRRVNVRGHDEDEKP